MKVRRHRRQSSKVASPPANDSEHVRRHKKKTQKLQKTLAVLVVLLVGLGSYLAYSYIKNSKPSDDATRAIQDVLEVQEAAKNYKPIRSKLGFKVDYYEPMIFGTGYILKSGDDVETVSGGDLPDSDESYSVVALEDKDSEASANIIDNDFDIRGTNLTISTSALKDFFAKRREEYGNLSDIELTKKHFEPKAVANKEYKLDKEEDVTIEGNSYKKLSYTITDTQFVPTPDGGQTIYLTVQNGRPFSFSLRYYVFSAPQKVGLFEEIVKSAEYFAPETDAQLLGVSSEAVVVPEQAVLADDSNSRADLPEDSANIPFTLEASTILEVVAKNQISVVRVGAIDCKDFDIMLPDGTVGMSAKDACSAGTGTGAIVSKDGYISTNGHVVKQGYAPLLQSYVALSLKDKNGAPFQQYLQYLVKGGIASPDQLNSILAAIRGGDKASIIKLLSLSELIPRDRYKLGAENGQYAIQLSDEPLKITTTGTKYSFTYTKEVVEAEFKDMNFDQYTPVIKRDPKVSDVAILKTKQGTYPVARLGSFKDTTEGALITSIGFPAFVDGGLDTTKERTVPSVIQGRVEEIFKDGDKSDLLIAGTSVPGAQGNSGGPNFTESGLSVGLTTYVATRGDPEAGVSKFAPGIMRNGSDFLDLLAKNKIVLDTDSPITSSWNKAIDSFAKAHYKAALPILAEVKEQYPDQYLVAEFSETAQAKIDAGLDKTPNNTLIIISLVVVAVLAIGTVVVVVVIVKHHKKGPQIPPAQPPAPGPTPLQPAPAPIAPLPPAQPIVQQPPMVAQPVPPPPPVPIAPVAPEVPTQPVAPQPIATEPISSPPTASFLGQPQIKVPVDAPAYQPPAMAPHTVIEPTNSGELQIPHDQS